MKAIILAAALWNSHMLRQRASASALRRRVPRRFLEHCVLMQTQSAAQLWDIQKCELA